jgi:Holliday junction resolvase RusA-like endonuclease
MLPFEFIVEGHRVSQQTRRRDRLTPWRAVVRAAAETHWPPEDVPVEQPIAVEITHFFEGAPADVDNIVKPILDALKGFVFLDDSQVTDLSSRRRNIAGPYTVELSSRLLTDALANGREFLHVRIISSAASGELRFL